MAYPQSLALRGQGRDLLGDYERRASQRSDLLRFSILMSGFESETLIGKQIEHNGAFAYTLIVNPKHMGAFFNAP